MTNFEHTYQDTTQFLSLTTLYPCEFDFLLEAFRPIWYKYYAVRTLEGKRRQKKNWYPTKNTRTLPTVEDKLFFLLVYYKQHPLQQFQAMTFGLSQAKVSQWIKILTPLLEKALKKLSCLPCRDGHVLASFVNDLEDFTRHQRTDVPFSCSTKKNPKNPETALIINQDVVEQTTPRPTDQQAQKEQYSGKKKAHTYKNKVDCLENQYIVYLSPTYLGKVHDKKIADEVNCQYPNGTRLRQDAGFQGYHPQNINIVMPFKKPKNKELTTIQKWFNTYVGQRRIVIEHAIRGVKRFHIIQHACRLSGYWVRDQIMNICTAIHNLRVRSPLRAYQSKNKFSFSKNNPSRTGAHV